MKDAQGELELAYRELDLTKCQVDKEKKELNRLTVEEKKVRCHAKKDLMASKKACRYADAWKQRACEMEGLKKQFEDHKTNIDKGLKKSDKVYNKKCNLNIKLDVSDVEVPCCKRPIICPIPRLSKFCDKAVCCTDITKRGVGSCMPATKCRTKC